jgi:hypothetical protein
VEENDGSEDVSVYSVQSDKLLMRFPKDEKDMEYCFYNNNEQYLIGCSHLFDRRFSDNSKISVSFWNVATGQHIGTWTAQGNKENKLKIYIHYNDASPQFFLTYCGDTKTFSCLRMEDVVAFDMSLNNLNSIDKALELALVSNKHAMSLHIQKIPNFIKTDSDMDLVKSSLYEPKIFDRLFAYDACLNHVKNQLSTPEQSEEPAKSDAINAQRNWLTFDRSKLKVDSKKIESLFHKASSLRDNIIKIEDNLLQEYLALSPEKRKCVCKNLNTPMFEWYLNQRSVIYELPGGRESLLKCGKDLALDDPLYVVLLNRCLDLVPSLESQLNHELIELEPKSFETDTTTFDLFPEIDPWLHEELLTDDQQDDQQQEDTKTMAPTKRQCNQSDHPDEQASTKRPRIGNESDVDDSQNPANAAEQTSNK